MESLTSLKLDNYYYVKFRTADQVGQVVIAVLLGRYSGRRQCKIGKRTMWAFQWRDTYISVFGPHRPDSREPKVFIPQEDIMSVVDATITEEVIK